jgi:hypothetical protein
MVPANDAHALPYRVPVSQHKRSPIGSPRHSKCAATAYVLPYRIPASQHNVLSTCAPLLVPASWHTSSPIWVPPSQPMPSTILSPRHVTSQRKRSAIASQHLLSPIWSPRHSTCSPLSGHRVRVPALPCLVNASQYLLSPIWSPRQSTCSPLSGERVTIPAHPYLVTAPQSLLSPIWSPPRSTCSPLSGHRSHHMRSTNGSPCHSSFTTNYISSISAHALPVGSPIRSLRHSACAPSDGPRGALGMFLCTQVQERCWGCWKGNKVVRGCSAGTSTADL